MGAAVERTGLCERPWQGTAQHESGRAQHVSHEHALILHDDGSGEDAVEHGTKGHAVHSMGAKHGDSGDAQR